MPSPNRRIDDGGSSSPSPARFPSLGCYVTQDAVLVVPARLVRPLCVIDVTWVAYGEEAVVVCPIHHTPLQLYNLESRELLCALCGYSASGSSGGAVGARSKSSNGVVVLSDLFRGKTAVAVESSLNSKLASIDGSLPPFVRRHQEVSSAFVSRRAAIAGQFELLRQAISMKEKEVEAQVRAEEDRALFPLARDILGQVDTRRHLVTSLEQLRRLKSGTGKCLDGNDDEEKNQVKKNGDAPTSTQYASIASAVALLDKPVLSAAALASRVGEHDLRGGRTFALEHIIAMINDIDFKPTVGGGGGRNEPAGPHTPFRAGVPLRPSPARRRSSSASILSSRGSLAGTAALASSDRRSGAVAAMDPSANVSISHLSPIRAVGRGSGACLFNHDLRGMTQRFQSVEWKLRVDEPGEYVGLGVVVTRNIDTPGSAHVWLCPAQGMPRVVKIRVAIGPHGMAKLSVFDVFGRQLDDGRVAHWQPSRSAFPVVTFGSKPGKVTMLEPPTIVSVHHAVMLK